MAEKLLESTDTKRKHIPTEIAGDGKSCGSVLRQVVEAMKSMVENLNNHIRNLEEITNILEIDSSSGKDQTITDSHNGTLRQGRIALNTKELVTHTSDEFHKHLNRLTEVKSYINSFEKYLKTVSAQNRLKEAEPSRNPRSGRISSSASQQFDNGIKYFGPSMFEIINGFIDVTDHPHISSCHGLRRANSPHFRGRLSMSPTLVSTSSLDGDFLHQRPNFHKSL